ncbi:MULTISPECIES: hypothetical protein [unclassified Streptomyces]|uniref:hypothetical protein n=1 Tax=unclassified Streptomyces TaxID=2593676 RepID=UPI002E808E90|nr:hypothetical protein [Streptomyces sp. NBC_00589]WTI40623.1 hypothetical protein OIC96_39315 [Streptomyces sp. NBC_00775]WUB25693.1 hypothetical protein OHA51_10415 [Streptomyces sp. NBC_00589]
MSAQSDRRWAQLARELEFTQLPELRRQAEGWRTGLTGLTALVAVLVTLKGRDSLDQLPSAARHTATALLAGAFLLLVIGSVLAVRAAHGNPGRRLLLAGQALRRWTDTEVVRVTRFLRYASVCCVGGIALVAVAIGIFWTTADTLPDHLVRVTTPSGDKCGELLGLGPGGVILRLTDGGSGSVTLDRDAVTSMTPESSCGSAG